MPEKPLSLAVPRPRLWAFAAAAGLVASALLYDSAIGLNLVLWTVVAVIGLTVSRPPHDSSHRMTLVPIAFALLLATAAAVTAAGQAQAIILLLVACLLALATVLTAVAPRAERYGAMLILTAPFVALVATIGSAYRTVADSVGSIGIVRRRPVLRGALIGIPVAIVFAALFADADPLFARGRNAIAHLFDSVDVLPRLAFFAVMTLGVLGAYAFASSTEARAASQARDAATKERAVAALGPERTIVLACAAAVSWLFVILQVAYLAVDAPAMPGSGVTYAEYAHRGFGQLSVVATMAVLLVVEALGRGRGAHAPQRLRAAAFALVAAVSGVLVSAFHRVTLYENAYGFTTARVHAQAYMLVVLVVLVLCAIEIARGFDAARLARATMVTALVAIATVVFWNDHAWVARQDIARFAGTKRLDVSYLTRDLAPDAYPALLESLPALPPDQRQALASALWPRATCELRGADRWFEWNLARANARTALLARGYSLTPPANAPCNRDVD